LASTYYFLDSFKFFTKKRAIASIALLIVFLFFITDVLLLSSSGLKVIGYNSLGSYYNFLFLEQFKKISTPEIIKTYNTATFLNLGFILPLIF